MVEKINTNALEMITNIEEQVNNNFDLPMDDLEFPQIENFIIL